MKEKKWDNLGFGWSLRCWQERAIQKLVHQLENGVSRVCLIAPPGAGKTICALALAARLERFVEVRVPTTALVEQWNQRIQDALVCLGESVQPPFHVDTYASNTPFNPEALLIMDEAHHLTAKWGLKIKKQWNPDRQILFGLTATPPYQSKGWERFVDLFGIHPVQIPAPPLVRESQLSPFQDLVWPVLADINDLPQLVRYWEQLQEIEEELGAPFRFWKEKMLVERWWELTEERFINRSGLLVALCRIRKKSGRELPNDITEEEEFLDTPTLEDRALVIWTYAKEKPDIITKLKQIGFLIRKSGPVLKEDIAWKALSHADARVQGALDVLAMEDKQRADFLRALIVCNRDVEGDVLSARQILKVLVQDSRTAHLEPILVSGTVFWVDEDIYDNLQRHFIGGEWVKKDNHYELDVKDWTTSNRVALATKFLATGVTRCLVGTRHLLGEGWDCPAVNCVIDVTGISTSVTVNQIRGRGLRPDPNDPTKVASLWDILSLSPGVPNGDRMLKQLKKRHQHTFGIDEKGRIRSGVERIDPIFSKRFSVVVGEVEAIQSRMEHRLKNSSHSLQQWAVGQDYLDTQLWTIEKKADWEFHPVVLPKEEIQIPQHNAGKDSLVVRVQRKRQRSLITKSTVLVCATLCVYLAIVSSGLPIVLGAIFEIPILWWVAQKQEQADRVSILVETLHEVLKEQEPKLGSLHHDGRSWWVDGEEHGESFAVALQTLLGPVRYPRYLLIEENGSVFAVPDQLAAHKTLAEKLARMWSKNIGACSVVYVRSEKGKKILRSVWKAQTSNMRSLELVQLWK